MALRAGPDGLALEAAFERVTGPRLAAAWFCRLLVGAACASVRCFGSVCWCDVCLLVGGFHADQRLGCGPLCVLAVEGASCAAVVLRVVCVLSGYICGRQPADYASFGI